MTWNILNIQMLREKLTSYLVLMTVNGSSDAPEMHLAEQPMNTDSKAEGSALL